MTSLTSPQLMVHLSEAEVVISTQAVTLCHRGKEMPARTFRHRLSWKRMAPVTAFQFSSRAFHPSIPSHPSPPFEDRGYLVSRPKSIPQCNKQEGGFCSTSNKSKKQLGKDLNPAAPRGNIRQPRKRNNL